MSINIDNFPQPNPGADRAVEDVGGHFASNVGGTALAGSLEWTLDGKHPTQVDSNYAVGNQEVEEVIEPKHLKKPEDLSQTLDRIGKIRGKSKPTNLRRLG